MHNVKKFSFDPRRERAMCVHHDLSHLRLKLSFSIVGALDCKEEAIPWIVDIYRTVAFHLDCRAYASGNDTEEAGGLPVLERYAVI